jgi:hypothetical protein
MIVCGSWALQRKAAEIRHLHAFHLCVVPNGTHIMSSGGRVGVEKASLAIKGLDS